AVCVPPPACSGSQCASTASADPLDHMLQAVHHLEAAGMQCEADRLRRQCDAEVASVIYELKLAQAELAHLHSTAYSPERKANSCQETSQNLDRYSKPTCETGLVPCGLMKPDDCEGCGAVTISDEGECHSQSGEAFDRSPVWSYPTAESCHCGS